MDTSYYKSNDGIQKLNEIQTKRFKDTKIIDDIVNYDRECYNIYNLMQDNYKIRAKAQKLYKNAPDKNLLEACDPNIYLQNNIIQDDLKKSNEKYYEYIKTLDKNGLKILFKYFDDKNVVLNNQHKEFENKRDELFKNIGNIIHESVPISNNENDNQIIKEWGIKKEGNFMSHYDLLPKIGLDTERGSKIAGSRAYFLTGDIAKLQLSLISYATNFMIDRGFGIIIPPYFMNCDYMSKVAQLEQFDEELYHVADGKNNYKYLIATSEQPIAAYYSGEILQNLPIKYTGYSPCFRRECGAHSKDTRGIFRVHQFDKIEQFCFCKQEESWNMMEEMICNAEEFYKSLEIPYRIINIVSGALNNSASKKYDLEAWFPGSQTYRELVSCSNCTEYQARNMNIKYEEKNIKKYVHTLNSTLCALTRVLCVLCETHYNSENNIIKLPKVLIPYFGKENIEILN